MERYFSEFKVEIISEPFISENLETKQTVLISLFDEHTRFIEKIRLGYIEIKEIFIKIDKNESLNLSNCYIEGFSLEKYRNSRNLEDNQMILLKDLNCENSFFSSGTDEEKIIDFSFSIIETEIANFKNCIFAGSEGLFFDNSIFNCDTIFDYTLFNFLDVSFSKNEFCGDIVSFKNSIFRKGQKKFEGNTYTCKEVLFVNTEFSEGDFIFSDSKFGDTTVDFKISRFGKGRIDFNKVDFGTGSVSFEKVEFGDGDVNFRMAKFSGNVEFPRCVFGAGDISFINTSFEKGEITFAGTEFGNGKLIFKQAFIGGDKLDFHYAHFEEGDITFERTIFTKGNVDFRAVDFGHGKVMFNRVNFGPGEVSFEASELKSGRIIFRKTVFGAGVFNFEMADYLNSELIIDDVDFGTGKVTFKKSKIGVLSLNSNQMNNYFDLRVEECGKLDLSNTIVKDIIDIDSSDSKTNIKALDISGMRLLGRIYIDWRQNNVKQLILQQDTSNANRAAQFRTLKQNYNLNGQYEYEDEAYVEFKRSDLKSILDSSKDKKWYKRLRTRLNYLFQWLVFDKVGLYATNPIRVLLSMTFVYVLFSLLFTLIPMMSEGSSIHSSLFAADDPRNLSIIQKAFYHSAVTFLTIGYGDFYPSGLIRAMSGIEGFTGLFLMSYFTVAFVRKILR
jgi:hypothetical protein